MPLRWLSPPTPALPGAAIPFSGHLSCRRGEITESFRTLIGGRSCATNSPNLRCEVCVDPLLQVRHQQQQRQRHKVTADFRGIGRMNISPVWRLGRGTLLEEESLVHHTKQQQQQRRNRQLATQYGAPKKKVLRGVTLERKFPLHRRPRLSRCPPLRNLSLDNCRRKNLNIITSSPPQQVIVLPVLPTSCAGCGRCPPR